MIRLVLLLLGTPALRAYWWVAGLLSFGCVVAGFVFSIGILSVAVSIATDVIGAVLMIEGVFRLVRLAAIGFPNATVAVLKALGFLALGFMTIDVPWDDNIVATVVLGALLLSDGIFRCAAAAVIRSERWLHAMAYGLAEIAVGAVIWAPAPVPYRHTVPFCIGIALFAASWKFFVLAFQLRSLRPGASITELPFFAGPNWHARRLLLPSQEKRGMWEDGETLTVHIWMPLGAAVNPQRRFIVDRYIAAVDQGGVISTGHAAMSASPNVYVSLCPADDIDHSPDEFGRMLRAGVENDMPGAFRPSLAIESAEWRPPDQEVIFTRFNAAALNAFLADYMANPIYNLTGRNCSSTVALALDAALEGVLGRERAWRNLLRLLFDPAMWLVALWRARAEAMTWTPCLVLDYARALQHIVEGQNQSWFARLRQTRRNYIRQGQALREEGQPTRSSLPALISLVMTGLIFGLTYGMSAPLIALSLTNMGFDETFVGANASMYALGVLLAAPILPRLAWRIGPKLPITVALLLAATVLALFPDMPSIWLWFPLRIVLGIAAETMFVMSETWLNQLSGDTSRARTLAIYTAALSAGLALGPVILSAVGADGQMPFLLAAAIALVALLLVAMPWVRAPSFDRPSHANPLRYVSLAPVAMGAAFLFAAVETAGMSFLPLYAMDLGWDEQSAMLLLSVLLIGAIALQLPIGWLGDRMDRRKLMIALGLASAAGAMIWPYVIGIPPLAYALLFVWGGLFVGIYTVTMAVIGSRFSGGNLVAIYAVLSVAWGVGAFAGPGGAGIAMELSRHGLPYFTGLLCAAFTILAIARKSDG